MGILCWKYLDIRLRLLGVRRFEVTKGKGKMKLGQPLGMLVPYSAQKGLAGPFF